MSIDPYGLEPQVEPAPAFPMEEVLRLIRQGQPGPFPQQAPPGFLDRLGAGLANVQAPGGGHAGDVFGANLLAGFGRSFGGNRVAARNQDLERQMAEYESGKAQKAAETQAQITGLTSDYESRGASAKESARALALWRKEKREYTAKQAEDAKASAKDAARDARETAKDAARDTREAAKDKRREFESDRDYGLRVRAEGRMSAKDRAAATAAGVVAGKPSLGKPPTEAQDRSASFHSRARLAQDQATGAGLEDRLAKNGSALWGLAAPNAVQSADQQAYKQAINDFSLALNRKESGATIKPEEFEFTHKTFFAYPGDRPEMITRKRRSRQEALRGLEREGRRAIEYAGGKPALAIPSTWKRVQ